MKLLEKFLYFSVGFASQTGDKLTELMQRLIEQNKITTEAAQEFLEDYNQKMEELTNKFDEKLESFITQDIQQISFVRAEEVKALEKRVAKMEKLFNSKVKELNNPSK